MKFPTSLSLRTTSCGLLVLLLVACETTPKVSQSVPPPVPDLKVPEALPEPVKPVDPSAVREQALSEALSVYADGRYDDAVASLTPLLEGPDLPLIFQVKVLKFIAFSHCAMNRLRPCRQSFDQALELDPTFQLTEAEKGHPIWGREFINARNAARNKRPVKKSS